MTARSLPRAAMLLAVLAALPLACREAVAPGEDRLAGLRGKTVGVVSLSDVSTLEARYVLQKGHGIDTGPRTGLVTFVEAPPESLIEGLDSGAIDAAVLSQASAFRLSADERFAILSEITEEARELAGGPIATSVLLSYPDVAEQRAGAFQELNRLLKESLTYYKANENAVLEAVAAQQNADLALLRWQAGRQQHSLGDISTGAQEGLSRAWQLAVEVGDISRVPDLTRLLFSRDEEEGAGEEATGRVTVSLALLDVPGRRAALYAIEQALVSSDKIDLNVTYLPPSALAGAATTKQYDIVEGSPLLLLPISAQTPAFVVVSGGSEDLGGTLLFAKGRVID